MYQALYRKWRPKTFDEVVGQPHVTETLKKQLMNDRLSHAYLFIGTRGTGKTSCAKILSKAVNCESPENGNPCNKCPACVGIDNGSVLDVEELDAASNNGVDNVRALRDEAVFTPATVKMRVYIIDEVHMLSISAFNALLKILEEPPAHLMFILATTESHKVPATILSRCQRYSFKRVSTKDIASRIKEVASAEKLKITDNAADLLGRLADGSVRDALSLLDQCTYKSPIDTELVLSVAGMAGGLKTAELFESICIKDAGTALAMLDEMYYGGKDVGALLSELGSLIRDLLILKIAPSNGGSLLSGAYDGGTLERLSKNATADILIAYLDTINSALSDMSKTSDRKLTAELCIITLATPNVIYANTVTSSESTELIENRKKILNKKEVSPNTQAQMTSAVPISKVEQELSKNDISFDIDEQKMDEEIPDETAENIKTEMTEIAETKDTEPSNDDLWNKVLDILKEKIDVGAFSVLSDSTQVKCQYSNGMLGLSFENEFSKGFVSTKEIMAEIKKAAEALLGHTVTVNKLTDDRKKSNSLGKLEKLSQFDNFSFK